MYKIGFISLGCPKALVDAEQIISRLRAEGYEIVPTYGEADLVIINTCGFINDAIEESLGAIEDAMTEHGKVIVVGCLGNRKEFILEKFPAVLGIVGPHAYNEALTLVHKHLPQKHDAKHDLLPKQGIKLTPPHYAYLKISEGCHNDCTFCIIPQIRGPLVSRPLSDVIKEANTLKEASVKEIIVIAQDTSAYGFDLKDQQTNLLNLATALGKLGIWIRLHYLYPYANVDKIIPLMHDKKILPYLDIPLQHASPKILKAMKRPANTENMLKRIEKWRSICPDLTIRSTFLVGFPGETDEDFELLLDFLEAAQLDRVGCFKYSPVDDATANQFENQIPEDIKEERLNRLMQFQTDISAAKLQQKIGKEISVIIDEIEEDKIIARTMGDAPDVDGVVVLSHQENIKTGDIVTAIINEADEYDLFGTIKHLDQ